MREAQIQAVIPSDSEGSRRRQAHETGASDSGMTACGKCAAPA